MKTYNRKYRLEDNDFDKLYNFVIEDSKSRKDDFIWHIARIVDWKYNLLNFSKMIPSNYEDYTRLWFDSNDELVGFVIAEDMNNCFQVFTKKNYEYLFSEMISWFVETFSNKFTELEIVLNESQKDERNILESKGFKQTDDKESTYIINTSLYKDFEYDFKDLKFESMKENRDYEALRELRNNVWPSNMDEDKDLAIREYTRKSPIYRDDFNFILVDNNGKHISGCEAFIDTENSTSEIERVCTHNDYWNNGYSKKVIKTAMNRLYKKGIQTAYITGWDDKTMHLYGSLGHKGVINRYCYKLTK